MEYGISLYVLHGNLKHLLKGLEVTTTIGDLISVENNSLWIMVICGRQHL